jgi:hypothetical protein
MAGAVGARPAPAKVGNMPIWDDRRCLGNDVHSLSHMSGRHTSPIWVIRRDFIANEGFDSSDRSWLFSQEFEVDVCSDYPRSINATSWF